MVEDRVIMKEREFYQDPTNWNAVSPGTNSRGEKIINHLNRRELHGVVKLYELRKQKKLDELRTRRQRLDK